MSIWGALLILLGIVTAFVLICCILIRSTINLQNNAYDERQQILRGKAYGFGLAISLFYSLILSICLLVPEHILSGEALSLIVLAGIMLSFTAVNLYCLMTGVLLPLNGIRDPLFGLSCLQSVFGLISFAVHIWAHGTGMGDDPVDVWEDLAQTVFWMLHAIIYMIAKRRDERDSHEQ